LAKALKTGFIFQETFTSEKKFGKFHYIILIRNQTNAKIEGLNLKYEVYKELYDKIDNMMVLSRKNEIKFEHIEKFCDTLIDIQNNFAKEFKFIEQSSFTMKSVLIKVILFFFLF
jgi:hypothetical protein